MQSHNIAMHNNYNHNQNNTTTNTNNNNNNITPSTRATTAPRPPRHSSTTTTQACAACKHRRSKCASDCLLAPYFPHDRHSQFSNAHRLFGVSNIIKIIRDLEPPENDHAMRTIIFESDARAVDPVGGSHRIVRDLEQQISLATAELEIVLHHLALCRAAAAAAATQLEQPPADAAGDCYDDEKWRGQYYVEVDDVNSWGCMSGNVHAHAESNTSSSLPQHNHHHHHVKKLLMNECNDDMIRPILDHLAIDDDDDDVREDEFRFDSHGNIIPSQNAILTEEKGTFKEDDKSFSLYVQDPHDLKAAATFFSLTNCNI